MSTHDMVAAQLVTIAMAAPVSCHGMAMTETAMWILGHTVTCNVDPAHPQQTVST